MSRLIIFGSLVVAVREVRSLATSGSAARLPQSNMRARAGSFRKAMTTVERWFGEGFTRLHPKLQELHRDGGVVRGIARLQYGSGLGGWIGRRFTQRIGIDPRLHEVELEVRIYSDAEVLHWDRRFGRGAAVKSEFRPIGSWPTGYWIERTGAVQIALRVDTSNGGWRWQAFRVWICGVRVPLALLPRVAAYKFMRDDRYVFHVELSMPVLGSMFSYSGELEPLQHN